MPSTSEPATDSPLPAKATKAAKATKSAKVTKSAKATKSAKVTKSAKATKSAEIKSKKKSQKVRRRRTRRPPVTIGWREWVTLPEFTSVPIKAKIDTGARTSALHAFGLEIVKQDGQDVAVFELHPVQRSSEDMCRVEAPILQYRKVRSSDGRVETRPVVKTTIRLGTVEWPIEVTLTSRDTMGFRMLLGRAAVRRQFLVNPGRSFLIAPSEDV